MRRAFLLAAAGLVVGGRAMAQAFTDAQRDEIVAILREALRRDPSILRDAFAAIQEAEERERGEAQRAGIAAHRAALFDNPGDPVRGNPRGDVTIVEFFDVRCPYCKRLHEDMEQLIRRDRNLRVVMKDIPILGPQSVLAARALLAAQRQGKYAELHDALMRSRGEPTEAAIRAEAQRAGLEVPRLLREMDDPAIQRRLDANLALSRSLRIEGTPALVIGDTLIPGAVPLAQLESLVAQERQRPR
ncbi:DsbA family protein [Roseomonas rosulenta]|uniref:DsbA family protein n=1 Tax=Roseomonas rosulenta TaxID=2748667 RepID=UPI0018E030BC|nr:DsbA family protein [Roseomonas rosulenta]